MRRMTAPLVLLVLSGCDPQARAMVTSDVAEQAADLELRRVWAGADPQFYASEPSPDGRLISDIDWTTGDLAVRDLETGARRRITRKGTWAENIDYAEFSTFSPDGQRLAYTWFREGSGYQLRVIGLDGSGERVLVPDSPDLSYIAAEDWSPDGRMILVTLLRADRSSQIATVSAETGVVTVLRTSDWRQPWIAQFSRDSRWIAYDFPDAEHRTRDIFVMATDASRESRIVGGPSNDVLLGWLPDNSGLLFYSDRANTRGIWQQTVRDGRPVGEAVLLRRDVWQLFPLGFSRDAYFFGVDTELPQVHVATLDARGERVIAAPEKVQDPSEGMSTFGAWSHDGRYFAYLRFPHDRSRALVIRPASGADTRELRLDIEQPRNLLWEPGSDAVLLTGTDTKGRTGVHRIDVRTGTAQFVAMQERNEIGRFTISPDGRSLLYWRARDTGERGFQKTGDVVLRDLASGDDRVLHEFRSPGMPFVSPDGRWYVKKDYEIDTRRHSLYLAPVDGSAPRRLLLETEHGIPQNRGGFPITPDGRHVLAVLNVPQRGPDQPAVEPGRGRSQIVRIPLEGGAPAVLLEWEGDIQDLRLSPDGRRISFGTGMPRGEVWMIPGLAAVSAAPASRPH